MWAHATTALGTQQGFSTAGNSRLQEQVARTLQCRSISTCVTAVNRNLGTACSKAALLVIVPCKPVTVQVKSKHMSSCASLTEQEGSKATTKAKPDMQLMQVLRPEHRKAAHCIRWAASWLFCSRSRANLAVNGALGPWMCVAASLTC